MQTTDILAQMGGVQPMAQALGVSESEAMQGAAALLPAILGGMKKQAQSQASGLEGLGGLLGQLGGGGGLLGQVLGQALGNGGGGNDILGEIFGSKDVSRTVAEDAANRSGLDASLLKKMLPILAMLVTSYLSQQGKASAGQSSESSESSGGLGDLLGGMLGGGNGQGQQSGLGGLASMLDLNGDGNVLDDILRMAGKAQR
ncbi:DUF937 domain-containing protein [Pseudomonas paralcaligenes]|uniref:DUF937 domain-containing protein n=1 Tax=Pseudomonas paralcaligenes TaxID=2772558 RepID=UPI001C818D57|nr:DUF937 domain-containing protein [Pseudomonas paralcaligenes]